MWAHQGAQIGMGFPNLLLMVKSEWSHTSLDEICFCLMEWRRQKDWWNRGGNPHNPELSVPVKAFICSRKPHDFHVGADFRGAGRTTSSLTGSFWDHRAIPTQAILLLVSPSTFRLNCRAEKSPQLWILLEKWKLHTMDMMGLTQVLLWLGNGWPWPRHDHKALVQSPSGSFVSSTEPLAKVWEPSNYLETAVMPWDEG